MASTTISNFLEIAIITQCLFSILYLSSYQWQRNKWLILIFLSILLFIIGLHYGENRLTPLTKFFIGNRATLWLIMPGFYYYVESLVGIKGERKNFLFLFILPFIFFYYCFLFETYDSNRPILGLFSNWSKTPIHLAFFAFLILSLGYFGKKIADLIRLNRKKYKEEYAETNIYLTLDWLRYLFWLTLALQGIGFTIVVLTNFLQNSPFTLWMVEITFLVFCVGLSYFSFRQPTLYRPFPKPPSKSTGIAKKEITSSSKAMIQPEVVQELSSQLDHLMEAEQLFLNAEIRMPEIAQRLKTTPNVLSWLLNEHYQMNFFRFINKHRVLYATQLLQEEANQHYTFEAISQMAGFKSKSTFNIRFKEVMGATPSQFRRQLN